MTSTLAPRKSAEPWQLMNLKDGIDHLKREGVANIDPLRVFAAQWAAKNPEGIFQGQEVIIPKEALGNDPLTGRPRAGYAAKKQFKHLVKQYQDMR